MGNVGWFDKGVVSGGLEVVSSNFEVDIVANDVLGASQRVLNQFTSI